MPSVILGIALLALGGGLMLRHWAVHKRHGEPDADAADRFARRQFRRRMRASGLIALLGVFVLLGPLVTNPYLQIVYWSGAMLVVFWLAILAIADILRTREHFDRLRTQYLTQRAALEAEVERLRRTKSNGHAQPPQHDEKTDESP